MCQLDRGVVVDAIYFDDVEIGYVEESESVLVDRAEMVAYAARNDLFPIHVDAEAASATPFGDVIASFGYVVSLLFRSSHTLRHTQAIQPSFLGALSGVFSFGRRCWAGIDFVTDLRSRRNVLRAKAIGAS